MHLTPTLQLSPAIHLIGDVDTVRVACTAQAKMGLVRGDLLVLHALSEVDFLFALLLPARGFLFASQAGCCQLARLTPPRTEPLHYRLDSYDQ